MANRSKKVVLSARIDPYLKAALELLAASRSEKIVKLLESFIENGLYDIEVTAPVVLNRANQGHEKVSFMNLFTAIWSEDEVLYKVRAGVLGPQYAGETIWRQALVASVEDCFKGADDLYGDLNGLTKKLGFSISGCYKLNMDLIREEWPIIESYVAFVENNKPFEPSYTDYKKMLANSKAK
ncbi:Phage protein [Pseudomonas jessenii]|uniref:Uncharacterized protein n=1 Tax=Pseudomonas laurylsulfatiphila TaxID=2011015 RepID=A0A2S6FM27_9PSED|nr:hypothetical protein [Pseudomonas laurylsulfatiphila]PPK38488.1 hypothetical protein CD175_11785 [Pseudomonas laurylsulfatiphila]